MAINKILFAADSSEYARKAVGIIGMLGKADPKLQVVILHVIDPIPALIGNPMRDELKQEMTAKADELLADYQLSLSQAGVNATTLIEQGDIAARILHAAKEQGCGMIVMGARGQSSLEEILLGSVSQKVLQFSTIPVLVSR